MSVMLPYGGGISPSRASAETASMAKTTAAKITPVIDTAPADAVGQTKEGLDWGNSSAIPMDTSNPEPSASGDLEQRARNVAAAASAHPLDNGLKVGFDQVQVDGGNHHDAVRVDHGLTLTPSALENHSDADLTARVGLVTADAMTPKHGFLRYVPVLSSYVASAIATAAMVFGGGAVAATGGVAAIPLLVLGVAAGRAHASHVREVDHNAATLTGDPVAMAHYIEQANDINHTPPAVEAIEGAILGQPTPRARAASLHRLAERGQDVADGGAHKGRIARLFDLPAPRAGASGSERNWGL